MRVAGFWRMNKPSHDSNNGYHEEDVTMGDGVRK